MQDTGAPVEGQEEANPWRDLSVSAQDYNEWNERYGAGLPHVNLGQIQVNGETRFMIFALSVLPKELWLPCQGPGVLNLGGYLVPNFVLTPLEQLIRAEKDAMGEQHGGIQQAPKLVVVPK